MKNLQVILRTADQSKKAEIDVPEDMTGNQVIEAAVNNWLLPKDITYTLVNATRNQLLNASQTVASQGVQSGDMLSLDTTLTAGFRNPPRSMDSEAFRAKYYRNVNCITDMYVGGGLDEDAARYKAIEELAAEKNIEITYESIDGELDETEDENHDEPMHDPDNDERPKPILGWRPIR